MTYRRWQSLFLLLPPFCHRCLDGLEEGVTDSHQQDSMGQGLGKRVDTWGNYGGRLFSCKYDMWKIITNVVVYFCLSWCIQRILYCLEYSEIVLGLQLLAGSSQHYLYCVLLTVKPSNSTYHKDGYFLLDCFVCALNILLAKLSNCKHFRLTQCYLVCRGNEAYLQHMYYRLKNITLKRWKDNLVLKYNNRF